jgi:uncharacterized protein with ATP-grasp and redox domains
MRLYSAKAQLDTAEKVLQELSKCIENPDPYAALKRAENTWRNYRGVYSKKYNETLKDVLSHLD